MKRRKPILSLIFLLILCVVLQSAAFADGSLLSNADFSLPELPDGWDTVAYEAENYSVYTQNGALVIASAAENDVRVCQMVQVEPNTVYRLSAEISAEGVHGGRGVCLSVDNYTLDGSYAVSAGRTGSFDWTRETLIVRTGAKQSYINFALRLGSYSETSAGTARFRAAELVQTNDPEEIASAVSLDEPAQPAAKSVNESDEARAIRLRSYLHLFIVCAIVLACVLLWGFYRNRERFYSLSADPKTVKRCFILLILTGAALRLVLTLLFGGHDYDISCWQAWGRDIVQNGTAQFIPPPATSGTIIRRDICSFSPLSLGCWTFSVFLPDLLRQCLPICSRPTPRMSASRSFSCALPASGAFPKVRVCISADFNPAAVILSGAWGQIDSILTLLLLLSFSELFEGRRISAGAIYGLAIMTKWQALIYGPVLAAEYLLSIRKKEDALRTAGGVAAALLVIFAVSLPFRGDQGFFWVVGRFLNSAGGYDYASVEAYNFLALCGGNWKSAELSLVPGIPYKAFGMVMIVLAVVLSVAMQVVSRRREGGETLRARPERLLIPAAFCMFMIFTFGHYMHERYVFPVMALLAFAYAATRDNRLLVSSMLLSVVLALNETTAMYVVSNAASAAVRGTQQHQIVIGVCSLFEVLTFFYTAKVCLERGFGQKDRR